MTDRRTGSVGVTVDLKNTNPNNYRQAGLVAVMVDLSGTPATAVSVSAAQSTAVALSSVVIPGGTIYPLTVNASQGTALALLLQPRYLTVTAAQPTAVTLEVYRLPTAIQLTVATSQAIAVSLSTRLQFAVLVTAIQTHAATVAMTRGASVVVATTQSMAVALSKLIAIRRATVGNRRVATSVRLGPRQAGRTRAVTQRTAVRLLQQVRLTRPTLTQPTSASLSGLPVQLEVMSVVQTRSLDLGRVITLTRAVAQATAAYLAGGLDLVLSVAQPTELDRQQAIDLTRAVEQAQAVSLEIVDVTPLYEILVTASVSQSVSLGMSDTGAPAKRFVVDTRGAEFVVSQRRESFAVPGRRARFVVGVR
jgi:hypothetical protein